MMVGISTSQHNVQVEGADEHFAVSLASVQVEDGVDVVQISLVAHGQVVRHLPQLRIFWTLPMKDIYSLWHPGADRNKMLPPEWSCGFTAKVTSYMPVSCLHNFDGRNRLTFALSDAIEVVEVKTGVHEESAMLHCTLLLFTESSPLLDHYTVKVRIDTRDISYAQALAHVQQWWAQQPGYEPTAVPEHARLPMYSTWYSFHQHLTASAIERQCRWAKELGCETVIVDDGWQTANNERGYAYCGDWQACEEKIPDMRAHVARIHDIGMKYILWYSVPFVGKKSRAWSHFTDYLLGTIEELGTGILDPRFPTVRASLIALYEQAVREWDLDGLKLDFVDSFKLGDEQRYQHGNGRDMHSVAAAVDHLLTDVTQHLKTCKPDIMIEFRQTYIGPLMRKYGNMFRAGDCPYDMVTNRVRTLDIRLLCGSTATHSDMIMWHKDETAESVALQFINILFAVPQLSVLFDTLPPEHLTVIRFWLRFWRQYRDVLLDGEILPMHPEVLYPLVIATTQHCQIMVRYLDSVLHLSEAIPAELLLINGTLETRMILDIEHDLGMRQIEIYNCLGDLVSSETRNVVMGLHLLQVPAAGLVRVTS